MPAGVVRVPMSTAVFYSTPGVRERVAGVCASITCRKSLSSRTRGATRCPRCGELLWCGRICQLRDAGEHVLECSGADKAVKDSAPVKVVSPSQLDRSNNCRQLSCGCKLKKKANSQTCTRCLRTLWCSKKCRVLNGKDHLLLCPDVADIKPHPLCKAIMTPIQRTHTPEETSARVKVELLVNEQCPAKTRAGVFAVRAFTPGECVLVEEPELYTDSVHVLPMLCRALITGLDFKVNYTFGGLVAPQHIVSLGDMECATIRMIGHEYGVPEVECEGLISVLAWFSTVVSTPLSGRALGRALYKTCSQLEHHCRPNTFRFVDAQRRCVLYAIEPIGAGDEIHCSKALVECSILPVSARYDLVRHCLGRSCACSACVDETVDVRLQDEEVNFPLKFETDGRPPNESKLKMGPKPRTSFNPLVGHVPPRRNVDDIMADIEDSQLRSTYAQDEMRYYWQEQDWYHLVSSGFIVLGDTLRSKVTQLTPPLNGELRDPDKMMVLHEQIETHLRTTVRYLFDEQGSLGNDTEKPPNPQLLAQVFTFLRWMIAGNWCALKLPLDRLNTLVSMAGALVMTGFIGRVNHPELRDTPELTVHTEIKHLVHRRVFHPLGALNLWMCTWGMVHAVHHALPQHVLMEGCAHVPLEVLDGIGIGPHMTYESLVKMVVCSELALNNTEGVFVGWLERMQEEMSFPD